MDRVETVSLRRLGRRRHAPRDRPRSTASPICSSTWPSRAPSGAAPRAIAEEIEAVGGHLNAYTSREHTAYYAKRAEGGRAARRRHHRRHPAALGLRPRRAGARARRDPAGDRPGQRHARRHHLRPFPGDAPIPTSRSAARCWARPEIIRGLSREAITRLHARAITAAARHGAVRPPASSTTTAWSSWPSQAFADLPRDRRRRRRSRRAMSAASSARTRDLEQVHLVLGFPGVGYRRSRLSTPPRCSRRCSAAACRRACSRRSARSAAWSTRSTPSPRPIVDGGLFGIYAGTGEDEVAELVPVVCDEMREGRRHHRGRGSARAPAPSSRPAS